MALHRALFSSLFLLIVCCTFRNNPYDPESPYYKTPILDVRLLFDSTKTLSASNDSIRALAPFDLSLSANAYDYFKTGEKLNVRFEHTHNNLTYTDDDFTGDSIRFISGGLHRLRFEAASEYGADSNREIVVFVDTREKPTVGEMKSNRSTLPIIPRGDYRPPALFTVTVNDKYKLADSVIYEHPFIITISHELTTNDSGICIDSATLSFSFNSDEFPNDTMIPLTIHIHDVLGRCDTAQYPFYFSAKLEATKGFPPYIDSIFIRNPAPEFFDHQPICFDVSARDFIDPDMNGYYPTDSVKRVREQSKLSYEWDFGDGELTTSKQPACHYYKAPALYRVKVTATDDSLNTFTDSIFVNVQANPQRGPKFSTFAVNYKSTEAPCTINLSVAVNSASSNMKSMLFIFDETSTLRLETFQVSDLPYVLKTPKTYKIYCIAYDEEGYSCDTSVTVIVTNPK